MRFALGFLAGAVAAAAGILAAGELAKQAQLAREARVAGREEEPPITVPTMSAGVPRRLQAL